jgi:hypothetical protein
MVALPLPRYYLPAANWEGDLMPERGPVQFLLHFLRLRPARGWKIGLAVALVAALALLPGEESLYQKTGSDHDITPPKAPDFSKCPDHNNGSTETDDKIFEVLKCR